MKAKERHKIKLIEFLGNPENEFCNRYNMATKILNFANGETLYRVFTPSELSEIELEALEIRRKRYSPEIAQIDRAVLKAAKSGDMRAARLCYQRFENWGEKKELLLDGLSTPKAVIYLPDNGRAVNHKDEG